MTKNFIGKIEPIKVNAKNIQTVDRNFYEKKTHELEEKFRTMSQQELQHYSIICGQAGLSESEKKIMLVSLTNDDEYIIAKELNIDISTDTGKDIYNSILFSANQKIVSRFGGMMK